MIIHTSVSLLHLWMHLSFSPRGAQFTSLHCSRDRISAGSFWVRIASARGGALGGRWFSARHPVSVCLWCLSGFHSVPVYSFLPVWLASSQTPLLTVTPRSSGHRLKLWARATGEPAFPVCAADGGQLTFHPSSVWRWTRSAYVLHGERLFALRFCFLQACWLSRYGMEQLTQC